RRAGEAPEQACKVAAAELLRENRGGERVDHGGAEAALKRRERVPGGSAQLEIGPDPRELRGARPVDRRRGGGERRAGGPPAGERVGHRGRDPRKPALDR